MNHTKTTYLAFGILLIAATILIMKFLPEGENDKISSPGNFNKHKIDRKSNRQSDPYDRDSQVGEIKRGEVEDKVKDPLALTEEREVAIEIMQEAATSYDPKELSVIRPYLESADPAIRAAAVDAMIVLGDVSAGPMLREAAKKISSTEESKKMEKAADYVELPSASFKEMSEQLKQRKAQESESQ